MRTSKIRRKLAWRLGNVVLPAFTRRQRSYPPPAAARAVIVSFYMRNIPDAVVDAQRRVLDAFAPPDVAISQIRTRLLHSQSIESYMRQTRYPVVLFLDIDCIPTRPGAIEALIERAEAGYLVGSAQRTNHLENGGHIYVAPSCMAISKETYRKLGQPSASKTPRGDVAEEFTYIAEERGVPCEIHLPIASEEPLWPLAGDNPVYGRGTTFANGFWHLFFIREHEHHRRFVERCDAILAERGAKEGARGRKN